ncbi:MAG: hypothetical protein AAF799_18900 [Myxococcota bacterium]
MSLPFRLAPALACGLGLAGALMLGPTPPAHAGARALGVVVVDVSEGRDAEPPRTCAPLVRRTFGRDENVVYASLSAKKLDRLLPRPVGTAWRTAENRQFSELSSWDPSRWNAGPKGKRTDEYGSTDTVVFVDCDPEARRLELVGYNLGGRSTVHVTLHDAPLEALALVGTQRVLAVAWNEFSP